MYSSDNFEIKGNEEKEFHFNISKTEYITPVINIAYKKYKVFCTSFCDCNCCCKCCQKFETCRFYAKYYGETFKIELKNIDRNQVYRAYICANLEAKHFRLPKGKYLLKVSKNQRQYLIFDFELYDSKVVKFTFDI